MTRTTTAADVVFGYKHLLGRTPENPDVIALHIERHRDPADLYRALIASDEFAANIAAESFPVTYAHLILAPPARIDHDVPSDLKRRMMDRVRAEWTRLGEVDPHWSVLSHEQYRAEAMDAAALERFYETGRQSAELVDIFAARTGRDGRRGVCMELGCGVGRITRHLADRFDSVVGVDISPGNLALCRDYLVETGHDNVETIQVSGLEDFARLPEIDYFYSLIVLQHNPPPIQVAILRRVFERLRPGGAVLFQVQATLKDYTFDAEAYLDSPEAGMEMHALPRHVVLAEMQAQDIEVVDVVPDPFASGHGSVMFYGVKLA